MNCEICNGTGWELTESGAKRCRCRIQREAAKQRGAAITAAAMAVAMKSLSALAFFPADPVAQVAIADALRSMCASVEALQYAVRHTLQHYKTWDKCGLPGLRQIVCTKFQPADGIEAAPTEQFPDGLPSETKHEPLALPPGAARALPPGNEASADLECERMIQAAAKATAMPKARATGGVFEKMLREVTTAPCDRPELPGPTPQIITTADVNREVERLREQRAKAEKETA